MCTCNLSMINIYHEFDLVHMRNLPSGRAGCTSRYSVCWCSRPAGCTAESKQCQSLETPRRKRSPHHQEREDEASSRTACKYSQKRDCQSSPEQVNSRTTAFGRPALPVLVRVITGTEKRWMQQKCGDQCALERKPQASLAFLSRSSGS
jgi:hypothetical protein